MSSFPNMIKPKKGMISTSKVYLLPLLLTILLVSISLFPLINYSSIISSPSISPNAFEMGLEQCKRIRDIEKHNSNDQSRQDRAANPRIYVGKEKLPDRVLILNATLWDGDGIMYPSVDILMENGMIMNVGHKLPYERVSFQGKVIPANGRFVTPGIVDMHSHAGLDSWPETQGGADTNEMSGSPVHPELKSLDGFDPSDIGIEVINSGGVTTSLILPGSGNIMGGEAFAFKMRKLKSTRAEEMLLNANLNASETVFPHRWMKMACGENAIWNGRSKGLLPESRLGEAYLFRERFEKARLAKEAQDEWCYNAEKFQKEYGAAAHTFLTSTFPYKIEHESLIALLRGEILLNVHCYETYDLEMMVRLAHEFQFKISAFHHALEAWEVADLLAKENIGAAIFADHWGYKKEAYDASVNGAKVLAAAGVKVAFKSDHPVLNSQNLIFEAAKAVGYGFPQDLAVQSVTSTPAKLMGQDHRIGYVRKYYDADVVIWDKNPLSIGAHPLKVFVDGYSTFEHSEFSDLIKPDRYYNPRNVSAPPQGPTINMTYSKIMTFYNIKFLINSEDASPIDDVKIVVEDEIITCLGPTCPLKGEKVDLKYGWVVPGLIAGNVHLGLEEIAQESDTSAGRIEDIPLSSIESAYGIQIDQKYSKILRAAFKAGVTTAISSLRFSGAVGSLGVAFRVGLNNMNDNPIIATGVGMNFAIGNSAKSKLSPSVPSQIQHIQSRISKYPLAVVNVESNSHIRSLLTYVKKDDNPRMIIFGGSEAHAVKELIASHKCSVILSNARCTPHSWITRDCLVSGSKPSDYQKLKNAGVNVGISVREDNFIRGLIWEAGWKVADLDNYEEMSEFERAKEAVSLLTWNVANAYQIDKYVGRIAVGRRANFVVYDGTPGSLEAKVRLVVDGNYMETNTEQF